MATIGIDATALSTPACGGIGTSQYQTMRALAELETPHRFVLYAARPPLVPFTRRPLDVAWPLRLGSGPLARSNIVWMQTGVERLLAQDDVEVFWGPRHLLPLWARGPAMVATVHDFWVRYYPGQQPWLNRTATRLLTDRVMARADVLVAPSASCARDVERFGQRRPGSVRVVPWGVDPALFRPLPADRTAEVLARLRVRQPYVLSLDVYNPRKGFSVVLAAVARFPKGAEGAVRPPGPLGAVRPHDALGSGRPASALGAGAPPGAPGPSRPLEVVGLGAPRRSAADARPRALAAELGLSGRVHLLGDVAAEDLVALYSGALALAYPSVYEGFGMPVLEAMACGCPVITADRWSLPEVAGGAALLVDPASPGQVADALARVAADEGERARLVAAGRARAAACTWRSSALGMLEAFDEALRIRTGGQR